MATTLFNLLLDEARQAVNSYQYTYVLLSGGLDSRIVAGVLNYLFINGELKTKPIAITWGLEDSRDVVYAHLIAEKLKFDWIHIPISPEIVLNNIDYAVDYLGLLHSPEFLHNMFWIKNNLNNNSIVFAGSFGDSIGRAEFSGLHLLQLRRPIPSDKYNLLLPSVKRAVHNELRKDIHTLFERMPNALPYMHYEHFMQGYRMRGGLCHALSLINGKAHVYQMFTSPDVYKFMWSLHPAIRNDEIYLKLLTNHLGELSQLPWARTNKALVGNTVGAKSGLRKNYHEYTRWSKNELRPELEKLIDFGWYENLGLFNIIAFSSLRELVRNSVARVGRMNDIWLWLAGFRVFCDKVEKAGKKICISEELSHISSDDNKKRKYYGIPRLQLIQRNILINEMVRNIRNHSRQREQKKLKIKFLKLYPPIEKMM